jgi:N-acetylmuramoyl-L-alanine amidase
MFRFNSYLTFLVIGLILFFTAGLTDAAAAPVQQEGSDSGFRYEPVGHVSVPNLNVRSGPGTGYPGIAVVHYGQVLYLLGRNEPSSWLQVRLGSGQQGWVMARYVSASWDDIARLPVRDDTTPPPQIPVEAVGYVTINRLNVRSGPGLNQPIMGYLWRGERVALLGRNSASNWLQIRLPGYSKGWVSAQYIQSSVPVYTLPITEVGIPEPQVYTGVVTSYSLNVRTGPGFNYPVVGRLNQGQQINVYGRDVSGAWYKIGLPNGAQGWAASQYIQISIPVAQLRVL